MPAASDLWKINGTPIAALGLSRPRLKLGNMVDDVFSFDDPAARFDSDLRWSVDAPIVLTRGDVVVFRGLVDTVPRFIGTQAESITYRVLGPWSWLGEYPFLQHYKYAVHPEIPSPELVVKTHGRTVLGQADDGTKLTIAGVISQIVSGAIAAGCPIALGTITGFDAPGVWDEVTDMWCSEAIRRTLNLAPDAVVWWDYSTTPPTFNLTRRDELAEITLDVPPPGAGATGSYAPFEEIDLTPLYKQLVNVAVVFYRSTDSSGQAAREILGYEVAGDSPLVTAIAPLAAASAAALTPAHAAQLAASEAILAAAADPDDEALATAATEAQASAAALWAVYQTAIEDESAAVTAAAGSRRALVRTIDLAGARSTVTNIEQPVTVLPFYARLVFTPPSHPAPNADNLLPGDADFLRVEAFWKRHVDWLAKPGVVVRAFRFAKRRQVDETTDGVFNAACAFELVEGAITDWMIDHLGIVTEEQVFTVDVVADVPIPAEAGFGATLRISDTVTARVRATNAQTQAYAYNTSWSFEAAESSTPGLAAELLEGHRVLQYDGTLTLIESEASLGVLPRLALNLACAARPEWATMRAQVQAVDADIEAGRTRLTLGPPKQLSQGDITATMFTNRTRREVTSANARATGLTYS